MPDETAPETIKPEWFPERPLNWFWVLPTLREIVDSKPDDYTYPRRAREGEDSDKACAYWHSEENEPGCLIGQLMARLGAPADFLRTCDLHRSGSGIDVLYNDKIVSGLFDDEAVMVLKHIQVRQDSGNTWAQALDLGVAYFSGMHAMMRKLGKRELAEIRKLGQRESESRAMLARVAEFLRQVKINPAVQRDDRFYTVWTDPSAKSADLSVTDLEALIHLAASAIKREETL